MRAFIITVIIITTAVIMSADECRHSYTRWPGHPINGGMYTCQKCGATQALHW